MKAPINIAVPTGEVTTTSLLPALPSVVVAVIDVSSTTVTFVAAALPIITVVPLKKFVPFIVIVVPPSVGPDIGDILSTVGAGS